MAVRYVRTNFTEAQKAEIFARDRATCCFSGKSLWILDYQLTTLYNIDWVDHVVPSSKGGRSIVDNGVCASAFFNFKKRNNSADNIYFFESGKPTASYFYFFGPLPAQQMRQLKRFSSLVSTDWYFNRCLFNVMLGLHYLAGKERFKLTPKRSDIYWFKSGWRRLEIFRRISAMEAIPSFEERKLLLHPKDPAAISLLAFREARSEKKFLEIAYSLYPQFYLNYDLIESFWEAEEVKEIKSVMDRAAASHCSPLLFDTLTSHYEARLAC